MNFDPELARQVWKAAKTESDPNQKGLLLELTVAYLFVTQANFEVRMRLAGLDSEFDLVLRSLNPDDRFHREIGSYVLVECKNTAARTRAKDVREFAAKVRYAACSSGVLVSRPGLTGQSTAGVLAATFAVRKTYHRDGTVLLLLTGVDLDSIVDGRAGLVDLLERRYEQIRFDLDTS